MGKSKLTLAYTQQMVEHSENILKMSIFETFENFSLKFEEIEFQKQRASSKQT